MQFQRGANLLERHFSTRLPWTFERKLALIPLLQLTLLRPLLLMIVCAPDTLILWHFAAFPQLVAASLASSFNRFRLQRSLHTFFAVP